MDEKNEPMRPNDDDNPGHVIVKRSHYKSHTGFVNLLLVFNYRYL